jgi:hypothetical protein
MKPVNFLKETLAAHDFAFFERFREILKKCGGRPESDPRFPGVFAKSVDPFQKGLEV